jgi:hypothetical protein
MFLSEFHVGKLSGGFLQDVQEISRSRFHFISGLIDLGIEVTVAQVSDQTNYQSGDGRNQFGIDTSGDYTHIKFIGGSDP